MACRAEQTQINHQHGSAATCNAPLPLSFGKKSTCYKIVPSHGFNPRALPAPPSPRDLGKFKSARVNQERLKFFRELCNIPGCPQAFNLSSAQRTHHRLRDVSHQELLLEIHKNICDKKSSFVLCLFIFRGFGVFKTSCYPGLEQNQLVLELFTHVL